MTMIRPGRTGRRVSDSGWPASRRRAEAGFTLVELLVVMGIIALLASFVAPRVIGYLGSARTKTAKLQIESLSTSLELFKLDTGRYPSTQEGLRALVENTAAVRNWNGPYLKNSVLPNDPWDRPYYYRHPGKFVDFDIFTLGADNRPGGEDEYQDVTNR